MEKGLVFLFLILNSCVSLYQPEVWENKDTYTLRLFTGSHGETWYDENFDSRAKELCPKGYQVVEKTFKPTTLHKNNYSDYHYTWVIKCLK